MGAGAQLPERQAELTQAPLHTQERLQGRGLGCNC